MLVDGAGSSLILFAKHLLESPICEELQVSSGQTH